MQHSAVAFIPARSGSKRVPHKNVRPLAGHPLLAYSVCAALESGLFSKVIVSTDSEEYAAIARHYGAEVPFLRSASISGERSMDIEWLADALGRLKSGGFAYERFAILRPTSPFRLPETIRRAWKEFVSETGVDSIRAVEKCKQHPGKMWIVDGRRMKPLLAQDPKAPMHSIQYAALPEVYVQNASLEIAYTRVVFEDSSIAGHSVMPFLTQGFEGLDINDEKDMWYAEHLASSGRAKLPRVAPAPYPQEAIPC